MMLNERRKIFKKLAVITGTFGAFLFGVRNRTAPRVANFTARYALNRIARPGGPKLILLSGSQ